MADVQLISDGRDLFVVIDGMDCPAWSSGYATSRDMDFN